MGLKVETMPIEQAANYEFQKLLARTMSAKGHWVDDPKGPGARYLKVFGMEHGMKFVVGCYAYCNDCGMIGKLSFGRTSMSATYEECTGKPIPVKVGSAAISKAEENALSNPNRKKKIKT